MKRRTKAIIAVFLVVVLVLVATLLWTRPQLLRIKNTKSAEAIFIHNGTNSCSALSSEDILTLERIFNNKILTRDTLYCGFSDDVCVILDGDKTLCFAGDRCPIVYWKEADKYFSLSEKEQDTLYDLLTEYGFYFPCV